ncbi:HDIG domain-containing metalloprotein [Rubricoccus marinus]|uniref:HAD family hydrolase n=1 Tax=Rubricoccus marinus TaxID=716817 RepID=A0A259U0K8_9BACT|nr:HAD family hydrolase [Rubricoccus marinus]
MLDDARTLLHAWTETDSLRRHAESVSASMGGMARRMGADEELWRTAGLLHDMDYERHPTPEEHPYIGVKELERLGYPEEMRTAILGHADYTGVARETDMAKALFAVDELSGFVVAVAFVRPDRLDGMTPRSVKKKLKDKRFAAAVSREDIRQGAEEVGMELDEVIALVIDSLQREADSLDLA